MRRFKRVVSLVLVFAILCSMSAFAAGFKDVKDGDWYSGVVGFVIANGIFSGVSETLFAPDMQITRAMLVTVLHRMDGEKKSDSAMPFDDVPAGSWYYEAVRWAASENIVNGVSEKKFSPEMNITREQFATILIRFASYKGYDVTAEKTDISSFMDNGSVSSYAKNAVAYAVGSGLIAGKTPTTINPKDTATRAEAALILQRFITNNKSEFSLYDTPKKFTDPFAPELQKVTARELQCRKYEDEEKFNAAVEKFNDLKTAENATVKEATELYEFMYNEMLKLRTLTTIASYFRDKDTRNTQYSDIYNHNDAILVRMGSAFTEAIEDFVKVDRFGKEFDKIIGEDIAWMLRTTDATDYDKMEELMAKSKRLLNEYQDVLDGDVTIEYKGKKWSRYGENQVVSNYEDYIAISNLLADKLYETLVPIYVELNEARNAEAEFWGFDSQADYYNLAYFARDYDKDDAKKILESIREHIVPIFEKFEDEYESEKVKNDEIVSKARKIIASISPEMLEIYDDMIKRELVFIASDFSKSRQVGYTTSLIQYASPIIYISGIGTCYSVSALIHEFGHYCDSYLNEEHSLFAPNFSLDAAEISSTALELIAYGLYDSIYEDPKEEKILLLENSLGNLVYTACLMDAQLRVDEYEGKLTGDVLKQIYKETAEEYGMSYAFPQGIEWIKIMQVYQMPFYNMSYVTAGIAALEMWAIGRTEGQEAAEQLYLEVLSDGSFEYGYMQLMQKHGLRGAVSEQTIKEIAKTATEELEKLYK